MSIEVLEGWGDFFVAEVGATGALLGLLVVAITINLDKILEFPWLPGREAETIGILLNTLIIGGLGLIPWTSEVVYGSTVLVVAVAAWLMILIAQVRSPTVPTEGVRQNVGVRIAMTQVATFPFVLAGIFLLAGGPGMYLIAIGTLASAAVAVANAWVLMVEIRR